MENAAWPLWHFKLLQGQRHVEKTPAQNLQLKFAPLANMTDRFQLLTSHCAREMPKRVNVSMVCHIGLIKSEACVKMQADGLALTCASLSQRGDAAC